jgi:biotin synthase
MRDAGYAGVYHALRLGEGRDNDIDPNLRIASLRNFSEAGLWIGTCVEPIGPERSNEEIARLIQFTASLRPAFSGAARRIPIPGTAMARRGMISELRMAQCVAVTRLAMPRETRGNCTHEPCTLGAAGGANLFWAETGANPRDDHAKTEEHRGMDVTTCAKIFEECDWKVFEGPSAHYTLSAESRLAPLELSTAM